MREALFIREGPVPGAGETTVEHEPAFPATTFPVPDSAFGDAAVTRRNPALGESAGTPGPRPRRSRSPHRPLPGVRGLSLTEVMIALALLSMSLSSLGSVVSSASHMLKHQRLQTQAMAICDRVTEELLLMDASDANLNLGTHQRYFNAEGEDSQTPDMYTAAWEVSTYDAVSGIRRVDVEVAWSEYGTTRRIGWSTWRN